MRSGWLTITVHPPAEDTDWRGDPEGDPESPDFEIKGCITYPGRALEDTDRGEENTIYRTVYAPAGSPPVTALDTVSCMGSEWMVEGQPLEYHNKVGKEKGALIQLFKRGVRK